MIAIEKFAELQKNAKNSYNQQKATIKKILAGKTVPCLKCQQALQLQIDNKQQAGVILCDKGCTEIHLEMSPL